MVDVAMLKMHLLERFIRIPNTYYKKANCFFHVEFYRVTDLFDTGCGRLSDE